MPCALAGQYTPTEAGASPNNNSGWGRVDLAGSVIIPGPDPDGGFGDGGPLKEGEEDGIDVDIPERPPSTSVAGDEDAVPTAVGRDVQGHPGLVGSARARPCRTTST